MLSDDLSSLFGPTPSGAQAAAQFRQGIIKTFSTVDGSNTVIVGTSILTNVPMLLTGAEVNYLAGDPVILMILGNTYMLLGKVAMVGSSQFASASVSSASTSASTNNFAITSSAVTILTASIPVPSWANRAAVILTSQLGFFVGGGAAMPGYLNVIIDGNATGFRGSGSTPTPEFETVSVSQVLAETVTPSSSIALSAQISTQGAGTMTANTSNTMDLYGLAVFTKQ